MKDHIAFLDEWVNNGLDVTKPARPGMLDHLGPTLGVPVSTHFIVTAISTLRQEQLADAKI